MKNIFKFKLTLNKIIIIIGATALVLVVVFFLWLNETITINNGGASIGLEEKPASLLTGIKCDNYNQRPIAVMMASDLEARPLSGISQADMVFEMPVAPNGITRFMAVFQCEKPEEIGSVRSAREDFIPLAAGIGAILAHWGGEHQALNELDGHIIDNIDAMKYEGTVFYRKKGIKPPHNGFTNWDNLFNISKSLNYGVTDKFDGYSHGQDKISKNLTDIVSVVPVDYIAPYNVQWNYDQSANTYNRTRDGKSEIDKKSGKEVSASVIVVMKTNSRFIRDQYIAVDTKGQGNITVYQNGVAISGKWVKDVSILTSKLFFYDDSGQEIKFTPGKIWVEIVAN